MYAFPNSLSFFEGGGRGYVQGVAYHISAQTAKFDSIFFYLLRRWRICTKKIRWMLYGCCILFVIHFFGVVVRALYHLILCSIHGSGAVLSLVHPLRYPRVSTFTWYLYIHYNTLGTVPHFSARGWPLKRTPTCTHCRLFWRYTHSVRTRCLRLDIPRSMAQIFRTECKECVLCGGIMGSRERSRYTFCYF